MHLSAWQLAKLPDHLAHQTKEAEACLSLRILAISVPYYTNTIKCKQVRGDKPNSICVHPPLKIERHGVKME